MVVRPFTTAGGVAGVGRPGPLHSSVVHRAAGWVVIVWRPTAGSPGHGHVCHTGHLWYQPDGGVGQPEWLDQQRHAGYRPTVARQHTHSAAATPDTTAHTRSRLSSQPLPSHDQPGGRPYFVRTAGYTDHLAPVPSEGFTHRVSTGKVPHTHSAIMASRHHHQGGSTGGQCDTRDRAPVTQQRAAK